MNSCSPQENGVFYDSKDYAGFLPYRNYRYRFSSPSNNMVYSGGITCLFLEESSTIFLLFLAGISFHIHDNSKTYENPNFGLYSDGGKNCLFERGKNPLFQTWRFDF